MAIPKTANPTYNYCGLCARTPYNDKVECNWAPLRWWDPDDGWKITTLCRWCWNEVEHVKPHKEDFAYLVRNNHLTIETGEDPLPAL